MVRAICMYVCASFVGIILYTEAGEGKEKKSQKEEKKEKIPIVGEGYPGGTTYLEVSPPAFHIRNRMLSKK